MLGSRKLIIDTFCEVYDQLRPWADFDFWDFDQAPIVKDAIYVIGREQSNLYKEKIIKLVENNEIKVVLSSPAEGSETVKQQTNAAGYGALIRQGKILLIGGGDMEPEFHYMRYDSFLPKVFDYDENIVASQNLPVIFEKTNKPYKFLFLNGRARPHRKYLLEAFKLSGLINQSLWTNLDEFEFGPNRHLELIHQGQNLLLSPLSVKYLPREYEVDRYQKNLTRPISKSYAKSDLFYSRTNPSGQDQFDWGEIYLTPRPYVDTYFSLVTETIFTYPYSFRTEKIWKPIAMGHPWIVASNYGYYRDMHELGFRSFGDIIDESFDTIYNNQERIEAIVKVVEDLCSSEKKLQNFLAAARPICEHNQTHLWTMRTQIRKEFPTRFKSFLQQSNFIDE